LKVNTSAHAGHTEQWVILSLLHPPLILVVADDCLPKPVDFDRLLETTRTRLPPIDTV